MAKAILVMDMPEQCIECDLWSIDEDTLKDCCKVRDIGSDIIDDARSKPDWCPLIPEPPQATPDNSDMSIEWNMGWNACLDYLEGKANE